VRQNGYTTSYAIGKTILGAKSVLAATPVKCRGKRKNRMDAHSSQILPEGKKLTVIFRQFSQHA
jgi:hypothetical protein